LTQKKTSKKRSFVLFIHVFHGMAGIKFTDMVKISKSDWFPGRSLLADHPISAVIIPKTGPLVDGLRELLNALPQVHLVGVAEKPEEVALLLKTERRALVLLDNSLQQGDVGKALQSVKSAVPHAICMVIAGDVQQRNLALNAGADWVELTGFPANALYREIARLLGT
jgi:DNA-binding NarL/FixJ family response regulator